MQGQSVLAAISSLIALLVVSIVKTEDYVRGDDAMVNKASKFINISLDILYTISGNIAGGALLAKALQDINENKMC
mgnify:CR=1 FL=1